MTCEHLIIGATNYIPQSTIQSNVIPVTPIDNVKNYYRSRQLRVTNFDVNNLIFDASFSDEKLINYISIAGHNLPPEAEVIFQIYSDSPPTFEGTIHSSGWQSVGELLPLGLWAAGVDPYADQSYDAMSDTITYFLPQVFDGVKTIRFAIRNHNLNSMDTTEETTEEETTNTPIFVSDGIYRQDETTRVVSIEAENAEVIANGSDTWAVTNNSGASGDIQLYKNGNAFYWSATEGPRVRFEFNATVSGAYKVWLRMHSTDGNSIYTIMDGNSALRIWQSGLVNQGHVWLEARTINLVAGQTHIFEVAARDHFISLDKLVILPSANAAPTGDGPTESGFGEVLEGTEVTTNTSTTITTVSNGDNVSLRMFLAGTTLQLEENFSYGGSISFLDDPELQRTFSGYSVIPRAQNQVRAMSIQLEMMNNADRLTLSQFEKQNASKPFLISPYPDEKNWFRSDYNFLARFASPLEYVHFRDNIHQTTLNLLEV